MTNEEIEKAIESGARNVFAQELTKEKYTKEAEEVWTVLACARSTFALFFLTTRLLIVGFKLRAKQT